MYLKNIEHYSSEAFSSFNNYFKDKGDFNNFILSISSEKDKNQFLRISSFYRYLIKDGTFRFTDSKLNKHMKYIDESYKYIAIFALIESLYESDEFVDFYTFIKTKRNDIKFPIENDSELDEIYQKYKREYGSIKKAITFFDNLDDSDKEKIQNKFVLDNERKSLIYLAKIMYKIRSEFVHKASFVLSFGEKPSAGYANKKILMNSLSLKDLMVFFEHGLLRHYGYKEPFH